jgi:dTDP-4-amino-4,6-dideoxygalactose transaminase
LPPASLRTLVASILKNSVREGEVVEEFQKGFGHWLGAPYVFGTSSGRSAFQLALEALGLESGSEIIFPVFTFPVMPMMAKMLGYQPVFCEVDPETYNSGPEHITPKITEKTGAVLATHLFGRPCRIREVAELARNRNIRLMEDCAHACGVRADGQQVGTFGDIGIYSFAEGKNMPCFGGGAIATADETIARRANELLAQAPIAPKSEITKQALSIWLKWLLTRPSIFSMSAYPALRLKLFLGQPLMDSTVGDNLLEAFGSTRPHVSRLANLQAAIGLLQLRHIEAFNEGARRNANILNEKLQGIAGIRVSQSNSENHIYVYYPLTLEGEKRDELRHYLLRNGIDTKITDMSDCARLKPFYDPALSGETPNFLKEASLLEICVYPIISAKNIQRIGELIRTWAEVSD